MRSPTVAANSLVKSLSSLSSSMVLNKSAVSGVCFKQRGLLKNSEWSSSRPNRVFFVRQPRTRC